MPKRPDDSMYVFMRARRSRQMRINGGLSETDTTALAVMPWMPSSVRVVMMVTPVARCPSVRR